MRKHQEKTKTGKQKKMSGLVVAHSGGHTAHSAHTGGHSTLGCMALGRCDDIINTQDHDRLLLLQMRLPVS